MDENVRKLIHEVIGEFLSAEKRSSEPAVKTELLEERRRREQLERRMNELIEENKRSRTVAEESEKSASIRGELQRLGVGKVDLAYRIVKDDIRRGEDGSLQAKTSHGDVSLREYLASFVQDNPEFLPARMSGGSGMAGTGRGSSFTGPVGLERIRPGMSAEELQRVREEISQVANQALRGQ